MNAWNTAAAPILLSMESRMDDLVRRNVENLRWSTLQNLIVAFSRFSTKLKQRLDETVASTKGAMEALQDNISCLIHPILNRTSELQKEIQ